MKKQKRDGKNKKERMKWVRLKAVSHFRVKAVMKS